MSRHRHIRNLNIRDELDDDALSDGGEDESTPEQQEQLDAALEDVRAVIGDENVSGLSDNTIKDMLWEYYFDIGRTVQWAIDEQERRRGVIERKGDRPEKILPPLPHEVTESVTYTDYPLPWSQRPLTFEGERSHVPLIYQAQAQQLHLQMQEQAQEEPQDFLQPGTVNKRVLSTIAEKTERTSTSGNRTSTATSYERVIDDTDSSSQAETIKDPNRIPVSPSDSALYRLSQYEAPPSHSSASSQTTVPLPPQVSNGTVPSLDRLPEIPDFSSKSSLQPQSKPEAKSKKSKLSMLASSRASSIVSQTNSESSRSTGTILTGSIKTYPGIRPTAQSLAPPSTAAPSLREGDASSFKVSSSASTHVRRAIQSALDQEARDKNLVTQSVRGKPSSPRSNTSGISSVPEARFSASNGTWKGEEPVASTSNEPQQVSKLALLTQRRVDVSKMPKLPKTKTEYLTPIANGSSVTTAITTSYQSLFSLTDPSRSSVLPKLDLVPLPSDPSLDFKSPSKRSTKLAMKIRKAQERHVIQMSTDSEDIPVVISPMFDPNMISGRALPSKFASLLINDAQSQPEGGKEDKHKRAKRQKDEQKRDGLEIVTASERSVDQHHDRSRKRHSQVPPPTFAASSNSAFDGPSPDDIVLNARRGTSLGQTRATSSFSSRTSTISGKS
ncbi:hypothetical protein AX17_001245 [Amanita inopinata Kibby_2008]|nr:hypothetical protein AX17_001245 [Amanita inopinata Kibby_2008]